MDALWRHAAEETSASESLRSAARGLDVRRVHETVGAPRDLRPNTIQSTLERLVRKGLAQRRRVGRAYFYRAAGTRREWIARAFDDLVGALGDAPSPEVLAGFVDFAERTDPATLERLQALVGQRLAARDEAPPSTDPRDPDGDEGDAR